MAALLLLATGALASSRSNYDYLLFVRQWGVTFCKESSACAIKPVERFTVHGLWPERNDHTWPACCDARQPFEVRKIVPLMRDLVYYWFSYTAGIHDQCRWDLATAAAPLLTQQPGAVRSRTLLAGDLPGLSDAAESAGMSLLSQRAGQLVALAEAGVHAVEQGLQQEAWLGGQALREVVQAMQLVGDHNDSPNYQFWRHEWEKHGTCALDIFNSEYHYFHTVLKLAKHFDLDSILADAGIVPSTKPYPTRRVLDAVADATGYRPSVSCRDGLLNELTLCVDKEFKVMDCPGASQAENWGCGSELTMLPAPTRDD